LPRPCTRTSIKWTAAGPEYEAKFRARHAARYRGYRRAQSWLAWPAMCNLIARRAAPGSFAASKLEDMIQERGDPRELFSVPGMLRTLLPVSFRGP